MKPGAVGDPLILFEHHEGRKRSFHRVFSPAATDLMQRVFYTVQRISRSLVETESPVVVKPNWLEPLNGAKVQETRDSHHNGS